MEYKHTPVFLNEVMDIFRPQPGNRYIDCTLGGGGHTFALAREVGEDGSVIALDRDDMAIENAQKKIKKERIDNVILKKDNFADLEKVAGEVAPGEGFDGILMDLGLSSAQLDDPERGFSYKSEGPLNMSFGRCEGGDELRSLVNQGSDKELFRILKKYGEEGFSHRIVGRIIEAREEEGIENVSRLREIIKSAIPARMGSGSDRILARVFQAFRMYANQELESLDKALPQAMNLLRENGILVVLSYHSLEDRMVKRFFDERSRGCLCPPEAPICVCGHKSEVEVLRFSSPSGKKKFLSPGEDEVVANPRARSAKLRAAKKRINDKIR